VAPAAARNRQPILDVLRPRLPAEGLVLEVASLALAGIVTTLAIKGLVL